MLFLPFAVYFVRFDEFFVGKKGHTSIREVYTKSGSLIPDFRTPSDCVSERERADWSAAFGTAVGLIHS